MKCILSFSTFDISYLVGNSNRTTLGTNLTAHIWNVAFQLLHSFPLFIKTKPILNVFKDLKKDICIYWESFDYSFFLITKLTGPKPLLDTFAMQVDEQKKVSYINLKKQKLGHIFKPIATDLIKCIRIYCADNHGKAEKLINADMTKAFNALEKVNIPNCHIFTHPSEPHALRNAGCLPKGCL